MKQWTKEELDLLQNSTDKTDSFLAKQVGRSEDSVRNKRKRIGFPFNGRQTLEIHKEQLKNQYDKKFVDSILREKADREIVLDILREVVPVADFTPVPYKVKPSRKNQEVMVVNISDVHIGRYSGDEFIRKTNDLYGAIMRIAEIQRGGADIDELVINMVGDIVDGDGIFPQQAYEQKFHLMEQIFQHGAPVFTNFLNQLSNNFKKITVNCVRGNHGRVSKFTDDQLNFDTIFYEILKLSTQNNTRIEWNITYSWYQIVRILHWGFLLTHGNLIKTWLNIPFYGIKEKGMRWQGSLTRQETVKFNKEWVRIQREYWDFLIMGHFHTSLNFRWNNWRCILNGTWLEEDDFATSVLGLDSSTEQTIFGLHETRGITWIRNINLSSE